MAQKYVFIIEIQNKFSTFAPKIVLKHVYDEITNVKHTNNEEHYHLWCARFGQGYV